MTLFEAYNGVLVRVGLYLLVFWPTVGYYVYSDSDNRDLATPRIRGVILGFFGIPGLLLHLALVERQEKH